MTEIELIHSAEVAYQTLLLQFKRPKKYLFEPGQYAYLTLCNKTYPDYDQHSRILSFASAPHDLTLDFLVRTGNSGFKRGLGELRKGDCIEVGHAIGSFTFLPGTEKAICLAGGIGIAPFFSIFKSLQLDDPDITLVWSNKTTRTTALFSEMCQTIDRLKNIEFYPLLTRQKQPRLPFISGQIDHDWLMSHQLINLKASYLICGSSGFVDDISNRLIELGIPPSHIKYEAFTGYE